MTVRVLLIEDDETIAEPLVEGLQSYGMSVRWLATGADGLRGPYGDIVLLDLGLPDMDGIDVCRGIRQASDVPVIILTARGEETDRVLGLELGADDYLAKPISLRELIARIRAVTRRTRNTSSAAMAPAAPVSSAPVAPAATSGSVPYQPTAPDHSYTYAQFPPAAHPYAALNTPSVDGYGSGAAPVSAAFTEPDHGTPGPLAVDRRTRQVWVGGSLTALTPKEFELLALLCEDPGAVYSRQQILDRVWDPHYHGPTKTLDVHVATLRRKLGDPAWIQTVRGVGFRLAVSAGQQQAGNANRYASPRAALYR
ncbi:response regulator transcription factor [Actinoplanes sp. NEAU-A12]|uniref:Sensory transduction protein RegX3 n=1 Tax=Actinoplanes sandaracinus TaxID=3045177 RepID=A0ABT6WX63_9ACTN|nr:response regulator transcription factor [Actinoplanes sandaracinus]MDI6104325.1 response regulator transcription factor [Actinoplanes sandaracinus]